MYQGWSRHLLAHNRHYFYYSLDTFLQQQRQLGFQQINLWACGPHVILTHRHTAAALPYISALRHYHLRCPVLTVECSSYRYSLATTNPERREQSRQYFQRALEFSAALQCQLVCLPINGALLDLPQSNAWMCAMEQIAELCQRATSLGLCLTLCPDQEDPTSLLQTPEDIRRLQRELSGYSFGIALNTALFSSQTAPARWIAAAHPRLQHLFVSHPKEYPVNATVLAMVWKELQQRQYPPSLTLMLSQNAYLHQPQQADVDNLSAICPIMEEVF